jgi:Protein of unknown function (DUF1570)
VGDRAVYFLMVAGIAACVPPHGPAIPALPSQGGPPWVELTSEHFVMWTDASAQRGRELIREMENHRLVVLGVALNNADPKTKIFVLALRDAEEVKSYVPPQFAAYSSGGSPVRQPVIVLAADTEEPHIHVITHELTHVISWSVVPHQPHWFAEGLAGYFETARLGANRQTVDVGEPLDYNVRWLRSAHWISTASLFGCTELTCMSGMFYAQSWALFSFLANEHPAELQRFMQRLAELPSGQAARAWLDAFPGLTVEKLDHDLIAWLAHGQRTVLHYKLKLRELLGSARARGARSTSEVVRTRRDRSVDRRASRALRAALIGRAFARAYLWIMKIYGYPWRARALGRARRAAAALSAHPGVVREGVTGTGRRSARSSPLRAAR